MYVLLGQAVERVTGRKLEGHAENRFLHLINSGSCTLDGTGQATRNGEPVIKPFWELGQSEVRLQCLQILTSQH